MKQAIMKFLQDEKGLTTVEYCVAGGIVAAAAIAAFTALGGEVATQVGAIDTAIGA